MKLYIALKRKTKFFALGLERNVAILTAFANNADASNKKNSNLLNSRRNNCTDFKFAMNTCYDDI